MLDRTGRSLTHAARSLGRSPAFVASVVLLLALGVGSVTTIFTLVDHVMLRPLPYPAASRLFELTQGSHSGPTWRGLQDIRSVESWGAVWPETANLTESGPPQRVRTAMVSEGFLAMFGARPGVGRLLVADDYRSRDAVVISAGLWQRTFGGVGEIVDRTLVLDGRQYVVAGVMDPSFTAPEALTGPTVDVWLPIDWSNPLFELAGFHALKVAGWLADGASLDAVQAEVDALVARLAEVTPDSWRRRDGTLRELPVVALQEATVGRPVRDGLGLLFGAVTLLLLVACTNVAHLFMARGLSRIREMAVRRALGARTRSIAAQLFAESVLIGLAGAALGIVLAFAGVAAFLALSPDAIPRTSAVRVDVRVLGFAVTVGALTSLVFGMLPALRLVTRNASGALQGRSRGNTDTRWDGRLRTGLVVAEVALSLMLVVQAGALLRSFTRLQAETLGFRTENVWTIPLEPRNLAESADWERRMEHVRAAVATVPGVRLATYGMTMPLEWTGGSRCCWRGSPRALGVELENIDTNMHLVDADYFPLLDLRLVAGRAWRRAEARTEPAPTVISEPLAIRVFGSVGDAVGREMTASSSEEARRFRVVGVVADNRHYGPDTEHGPAMYMPAHTIPFGMDRAHIAVLVDRATPGLAEELREAVWSVEPDLPVPAVRMLTEWASEATARARFQASMFATFGIVTVLLMAGGLYGTLLYTVGRRRRELGIRLALGDAPGRVERDVLRSGLAAAVFGCLGGAFGAWGMGKLLSSTITGLESGDPALLAGGAGLLILVALTASWLPARRAARTDPLEVLRAE